MQSKPSIVFVHGLWAAPVIDVIRTAANAVQR